MNNTATTRKKTQEKIAQLINHGLEDIEILRELKNVPADIYIGIIRDLMTAKNNTDCG